MRLPDDGMARRLREARLLAGYSSAAAAARALAIPIPTYCSYENSGRGLHRAAPRLARFFKVDLDWLLTGRGKPRGSSIESALRDLAPDEVQQVVDLIGYFKARAARRKAAM